MFDSEMILWEAYRDFVCLTMVLGTLIYDTRVGLSTRWRVLGAGGEGQVAALKSVTRSGLDIQDMGLAGTCPDFSLEKERWELLKPFNNP